VGDCPVYNETRLNTFHSVTLPERFDWKLQQLLVYLRVTSLERLFIPSLSRPGDE